MKSPSTKINRLFSRNTERGPVYIISEIGINHNGSLQTALDLIDASKDAGVDAVKFQKRNLKKIYSEQILKDANSAEWNFEYLIPLLKEVELTNADYKVIKKKCDALELDLIVTPFDEDSAAFVASLGIAAFKLSSSDMTNFDLVKKCASYDLPLIISTGMWTENDIKVCTNYYRKNKISYALLLTNSTYPAPYESLNLEFLHQLKHYAPIVGYSGHERGIFVPIATVAMGGRIVEKHITFNREDAVKVGSKIRKSVARGPDHKASLLPKEFKAMVRDLRLLEKTMGRVKEVNQAEKLNREAFAKSAVLVRNKKRGQILRKADVVFRAPGKGLFRHEVHGYIGKKLHRDVPLGNYVSRSDFEKVVPVAQWKPFSFSGRWGVKCRFHDFEDYKHLKSPVVEFHCSESDLNLDFTGASEHSELIIHAPEVMDRELVNICSDNERIVKKSLILLQKTIDKTVALAKNFPKAKPKIVIHFGGMHLDPEGTAGPNDDMMARAITHFKKLRFDPRKVEILAENLPPRPWYLGGQWHQYGFGPAEDMVRFCKTLGIGMTFDICHAALYCNHSGESLEDYISKTKKYIKHLHISDATGISGEGVQVGEGTIDFAGSLALLKGHSFSWVPEIWSGHLYEGAGFYKAFQKLEKFNHIL